MNFIITCVTDWNLLKLKLLTLKTKKKKLPKEFLFFYFKNDYKTSVCPQKYNIIEFMHLPIKISSMAFK